MKTYRLNVHLRPPTEVEVRYSDGSTALARRTADGYFIQKPLDVTHVRQRDLLPGVPSGWIGGASLVEAEGPYTFKGHMLFHVKDAKGLRPFNGKGNGDETSLGGD